MTHKPLLFSAFVMNTPSHIVHGLWRAPSAKQHRFNELDFWIDIAKTVEKGGFDNLFFADLIGVYSDHRGSWRDFPRKGLQIPSNDPMVLLSAIASHTEHLGLAFTASPIQEPPFNFARRVSTLDHATKGRIGWNVVTSALENSWRNFGRQRLDHDERYRLADEYLEVAYKLWEGSWDDGAIVNDPIMGVFADPERIHKIYHNGEYFNVEGPHLVAPSPQRTPVLFQAGASPTGRDFAARHAEAQFIVCPDPSSAARLIESTRNLAARYGRRRGDIKFFQGMTFVVGSTDDEARRREAELESWLDVDGMIAHFGGMIGVDLGRYEKDTPIDVVQTESQQASLNWLRESAAGRTPTLGDVVALRARSNRIVGTPERIADALEIWRDAGVDGINVTNSVLPGSFEEFAEHVMPVLRKRGLARLDWRGTSFRSRLFGHDLLPDRHPGARYRRAFSSTSGPTPTPNDPANCDGAHA
ncbi:LLM class flavin-dependent oxidoreductase [Mycolicibacterium goodii]|uniref:LLM class flavin-dependent oxidoreductase n=1 Tax=Mycolicibacterium goodii TaxID=134601 RepID=UPI001BDC0F1D|nr:LLM class flavin-dependent oxidoreductase [Mycolicibacterium goodii]MBU8816709.1 LLM class flavin-dependent oxidoreductase [Mycolicibacterium goodii]